MAQWESFYEKIIKPVDFLKEDKIDLFRKMTRQRAEEISSILVGLAKHKLEETYFDFGDNVYRPVFKNIKTNEDLVREEFRGAVQRYILGMDDDALIHACSALEAGLLVKDEEKLKTGQLTKNDIRHPFTLGRNTGLWLPKSKKNRYGKAFIKNKTVINRLKRVKTTRDCHVHGFNFIASTVMMLKSSMTQYESGMKLLDSIKLNIEKVQDKELTKQIELARSLFPSELMQQIEPFLNPRAFRMILSDFTAAAKAIENLSDFRWCAEKEPLKLARKRLRKYGLDFFHLVAKETLYDTYAVLTHIGIL